ncbi:MAG: helix-turn-helix domain-containing protein [Planctomycetes bacterium]|nr:helix-turn-helix domain-containing protein [Planctomycetota bacterium]
MTPRGAEVLKTIRELAAEIGCTPSLSQLASRLLRNKTTVYRHIVKLEAEGLVKRTPGRKRSVVPVEPKPAGPLDEVYGQAMVVLGMELEAALIGRVDVERVRRMAGMAKDYAKAWIAELIRRAAYLPGAP